MRGPLIVMGAAAFLALCTLSSPSVDAGSCGYGYPTYYAPYRPYCAPAPYCPAPAVAVPAVKEPPLIAVQALPVVVQEVLAPAVVFQTLSAYQVPQAAGYAYTGQKGSYTGGQQFQATSTPSTSSSGYGASGYSAGQAKAGLNVDDALIDALAARLAAKLGTRADDPVPRIGGNGAPAQSPQQGNGGGEIPPGVRAAIEYMGTACASCHQEGQKTQGGVTLFTSSGEFRPGRQGRQIVPADVYEAMSTNMPLGGARPPAAVMAALKEAGWDRR